MKRRASPARRCDSSPACSRADSTRFATQSAELGPGAADADAQSRAYEALARALPIVRKNRPGLAGLFLWKWDIDPLAAPDAARSFSPRHKPAESALRELFGAE